MIELAIELCMLEGFAPLLDSPTGLDLKLAKRARKITQSRDFPGAIFVALGDQIWRIGGSF